MLRAITTRIAPLCVRHVVLDGYFGTYPATFMVRHCALHLISKLHHIGDWTKNAREAKGSNERVSG
jgi:hypothetical protein